MWCYRIDKVYEIEKFTFPISELKSIPRWNRVKFDNATRVAIDFCRHIDWDGTFGCEVRCFATPGVNEMAIGYIWRDIAGRTFISSPMQLWHIEKVLDWDAMVSHEEVARTRSVILAKDDQRPNASITKSWKTTANGNFHGAVNGCNTTVFAVENGWKAIINPIGKGPIYTRVFTDPSECMTHVVTDFYEIIEPAPTPEGPISDDDLDW